MRNAYIPGAHNTMEGVNTPGSATNTREKKEHYGTMADASADIKRMAETIKKANRRTQLTINESIESCIANGWLTDAWELRKTMGKVHPLSKEESELKDSARQGIASLMLSGGSLILVRSAMRDYDVDPDSLLPEARETFKKAIVEENYDKAGELAIMFELDKTEAASLSKIALSESNGPSKKTQATYATLEQFEPRK